MVSKDLALIYGVLLGDGCLSKTGLSNIISITCNIHSDLPFINFLIPILEKVRGKEIKAFLRPEYGKVEINFSDKELFNKIKDLEFPIGKKGTNLSISEKVACYIEKVIKGYFATDGCLIVTNNNGIIYPRIEFSSISKILLDQLSVYLTHMGIRGKVYVSHKNNFKSKNPLYRLQINGKKQLLLFEKKIGFINPKHQDKFNLFYKNL